MTQKEFAAAMEIAPETVSRWESADGNGIGGFAEKSVRQNVCALICHDDPGLDYDPADITRMQIVTLAEGMPLPLIEVELVTLKHDGNRSRVWDAQTTCIAA